MSNPVNNFIPDLNDSSDDEIGFSENGELIYITYGVLMNSVK